MLRLFRVLCSRRLNRMSQGALTSSQAFVLSRKRLQTRLQFAILCVCPALHWHARLAKSGSYGFPFRSSVVHQSTHGTSQCWAYVLDPHLNQRNSKFKKRYQGMNFETFETASEYFRPFLYNSIVEARSKAWNYLGPHALLATNHRLYQRDYDEHMP